MKVKIKRKFCSYSDGQKVSAEETAFDFYGRELFGDGFFVCADCKRSYCRFMVVLSDGNELMFAEESDYVLSPPFSEQ